MPVIRMASERVDLEVQDSGVVLTIRGCLDRTAGEALVQATTRAVAERIGRLDIDLCSLTGFTGDGAGALVACKDLCASLPDGLHYRTGQGPGREALLAAYADC